MIKILDSSFKRLCVVKNVIEANRFEELNGENTLDFSAILDMKLDSFITEDSILEIDEDYFETSLLKKQINDDDTLTIDIESEHISYRLNNPTYNMEYFTQTGTPTFILGEILQGTGFSVGTVEYTNAVTYSAQEAKSRRQLLMEFVTYLGGEVDFDKLSVNIKIHRGDTKLKPLVKGKNINIISKTINKKEKDQNGNYIVSYSCDQIYLPGSNYELGDEVLLFQEDFGLEEYLRIVSVGYNPYNITKKTFQFSNAINGLENGLYRIETSTVIKDKLYNGTRIGPEFGFEAVRSDKMARAYLNSTNLALQAGDGSGNNWFDRVYFDSLTGKYKFIGELIVSNGGTEETIIDEYGMDTRFIKWFKNMCFNSSFEVFDPVTKVPKYWSAGESVNSSSFFGSRSLKLTIGQSTIQSGEGIVNSTWYDSVSHYTRVSFHKWGGRVKISVLDGDNADTPFTLTDEEGNTGAFIQYDVNTTWIPESYHVSFAHGTSTKVKVKFENTDIALSSYIDAVVIEPDYTRKRPSFYTDGPNSVPVGTGGQSIETYVPGNPIYVQDNEPTDAKEKDVWIDTNDYSRYDVITKTSNCTLVVDDPETILCNGTFTVTLHTSWNTGVLKKLYNIGTGIVTITGGIINICLYPGEAVELITDGTNWRMM